MRSWLTRTTRVEFRDAICDRLRFRRALCARLPRATRLAFGAEHRAASALLDARERRLATRAWLAAAAVHAKRIRRARLFDVRELAALLFGGGDEAERLLDRHVDRARDRADVAIVERGGLRARIDLRAPQRFGREDVADARDHFLIHQ